MKPYLEEEWAASFAMHRLGGEQISALEGRLQMLYDLANAKWQEDEFVFTSSGSEAISLVLWSVFLQLSRKTGQCHFITSSMEDAPLMLSLKRLEELGCFVKIAPCDESGRIDLVKLKELMSPRTALVSLSLAQGLTGVLQPVGEVAKLCEVHGALFHVDATYAVGKVPLTFQSDYLTFAGDRMHGLKSSGALFVKKGRPLSAPLPGSYAIDVPSLVALSAAAQQATLTLEHMGLEVARLRNHFEQGILERIPEARVLFSESMRLSNVSVILFPRVHQEAMLYALNQRKVYASIGGGTHQQLSKLSPSATCAISFALSRLTTEEEINEAILRVVDAFTTLALLSERL
jgi:cysteine desulfurase